jgi:hypothetical protein
LIPDVLWELTKGFVDLISKLNKSLLIFDDFEKKVDYGQKIKICEKEVGDFTTSKCARNCISVFFFVKKKIFGGQQPLLKPYQNVFLCQFDLSYFYRLLRVVTN